MRIMHNNVCIWFFDFTLEYGLILVTDVNPNKQRTNHNIKKYKNSFRLVAVKSILLLTFSATLLPLLLQLFLYSLYYSSNHDLTLTVAYLMEIKCYYFTLFTTDIILHDSYINFLVVYFITRHNTDFTLFTLLNTQL